MAMLFMCSVNWFTCCESYDDLCIRKTAVYVVRIFIFVIVLHLYACGESYDAYMFSLLVYVLCDL